MGTPDYRKGVDYMDGCTPWEKVTWGIPRKIALKGELDAKVKLIEDKKTARIRINADMAKLKLESSSLEKEIKSLREGLSGNIAEGLLLDRILETANKNLHIDFLKSKLPK